MADTDVADDIDPGREQPGPAEPDDSDDTDTDAAADEVAPQASSAAAPPGWLARAVRVAAMVVFVAVLAVGGYEGWLLFQRHRIDADAEQAHEAARAYAVTLTSNELDGVDENVSSIIDGATGEFKDKYGKVSSQMRKLLIDNRVVSHGTVADSAVKSATTGKVDVLLVVEQSVTSSPAPEPQSDLNPIAITMEKVDGRWLASNIEVFGR